MRGKIVISLTRRYETDLLAHIDLDRPVEVRVIRSAHPKKPRMRGFWCLSQWSRCFSQYLAMQLGNMGYSKSHSEYEATQNIAWPSNVFGELYPQGADKHGEGQPAIDVGPTLIEG